MQTFLPYANFHLSAECLDNKRLNKQIVEVQQILKALTDPNYGWQNHPAVKMWRGYEFQLCLYGMAMNEKYAFRFNRAVDYHKSGQYITSVYFNNHNWTDKRPPWLGDVAFHASHRSNLLRKDKDFYSQFGWKEPDNLPYIWPI